MTINPKNNLYTLIELIWIIIRGNKNAINGFVSILKNIANNNYLYIIKI